MLTLNESRFDLEGGQREDTSITTTDIEGLVLEDHVEEKGRESLVSEFSVIDLESDDGDGGGGDEGREVHLLKVEKDCRICHLSLDVNSEEYGNNGIPIELGCCCKDDLAAAHKQCAEAWFKIKGNRTCEICGSIAQNVAGADEDELIHQWNEPSGSLGLQATAPSDTMATLEAHNLWQGHRFLNILLASMVFAFVISWLFHFNVPS